MKLGRSLAVAGVVVALLGACATGKLIDDTDGGSTGDGSSGDGSTGGCPTCSGSTPKCDPVSKTCVACLADPDCADSGPGAKCSTTTHTCKPACTTDTDCTSGTAHKCDTTQHVCVECLTTNDTCPSGEYCEQGACKSGCKIDNDCAASLDGGTSDGGSTAVPSCCNHVCADISADEKNCGKCGTTCTSSQLCCNSTCAESQTSTQNCGACGKVCAPKNVTTPECTAGACGYDTCISTSFGDCDNDKTNGCEDDLTSDNSNCGKCGTICGSGQKCVSSVCVSCGTNEVAYNGHCYYLDGSGGACDTGFSRAAESVLSSIASSFIGKNYEHTISSNCCIWTSDTYENWGMASHCNANGPFSSGDPQLGAYSCTSQTLHGAGQLTFCGSN